MRSNRIGFTLIEVVVGLVLMGSLVASGLVAMSSHQHAIELARRKQAANTIAESLLTNWYEIAGEIPTRAEGAYSLDSNWLWRTQPIGSRWVCGLPVVIVRLEIISRSTTSRSLQSYATIELVQKAEIGADP